MISRRQVADLHNNRKGFELKKVQLVVIGNGPEKYIAHFRKATRYNGLLFTNPAVKTYKILGFKKGVATLMGFSPLKAGIRALGSGYLQKGIQGSLTQQGGVLVIGPGQSATYLYRSQKAGDHPTVGEILQAC